MPRRSLAGPSLAGLSLPPLAYRVRHRIKRALLFQREILIIVLFCLGIFGFNLSLAYFNFVLFKEQKHPSIEAARVVLAYEKINAKPYLVIKLATPDFSFYTTSYKPLTLRPGDLLDLRIINAKVDFWDYLSGSFYVPSYDLKPRPAPEDTGLGTRIKQAIISYFLDQHPAATASSFLDKNESAKNPATVDFFSKNEVIDPRPREFYGALFFALPVSSGLRRDVNFYGIAHLIAISGYHIGLLFGLSFTLLSPLYSFFQRRFFPQRNARLDLSLLIFALLFAYTALIGLVPSYLRSLVMALWGFYLLCKRIRLLSFTSLALSVLICLALYPGLLFSVGFFFSVLGVFFIFLYWHHFSGLAGGWPRWLGAGLHLGLVNIWTFLAMIAPVLYFFPLISFQQFLAVPLSAAFVLFYPLVLFLHLLGLGGLFDPLLVAFFDLKFYGTNLSPPTGLFLAYLGCAFGAIFSRTLALCCVGANLIPFAILLFDIVST